jgi:hypothetical protein
MPTIDIGLQLSGTLAWAARRTLRAISGFIVAQLIIGVVFSFAWGAAVPAAAATPLGWEVFHTEGDVVRTFDLHGFHAAMSSALNYFKMSFR